MRQFIFALCLISALAIGPACSAKTTKTISTSDASNADGSASTPGAPTPGHIEVTADKSLEWYQDQRLYVARGNAKAIRGDMTVTADLLTAHERDTPPKNGTAASATTTGNAAAATTTASATAPAQTAEGKPAKQAPNENGTGDIDKMTAEGHVRVVTSKSDQLPASTALTISTSMSPISPAMA